MPFDIFQWRDLEQEFAGGTLLLGNGSSRAVDERFRYESLKEHAIESGLLSEDVEALFEFFDTDDFELILRLVWQATNVNQTLDIRDTRTRDAYLHVRDCLIRVVRDIHPEYEQVERFLPDIYDFMKEFGTILSLNYDLIVYWTMMYGSRQRDGHAFKDCFIRGTFNEDWREFREPIRDERCCSLVFYPHGNLILARDIIEDEIKLSRRDGDLLENVLRSWQSGDYVPLFVSEGTRHQKVRSIRSSNYLSTVYRDVLSSIGRHLVILGWAIGEQDVHILERIKLSSVRHVAVSVFRNDQAFCNYVDRLLRDEIHRDLDIVFFDAESPSCWRYV
ncbi:DUF4917 family protein [Vibrio parahaemolyticus]|uniref:DUF4917 family protein n=1 Tax=Vibrio parahaemolyticus TaxID=670 RepID=UPI00111EB63D|nr:DUF4917 family protein [Vibrio parahaemolyticus]ELA8132866.1 DUF4917 family protein [Vibrio parahaemolyticus]TOK51081.1 DUF4917 domain-containing protein [Vibrio parahaemolyticus]TOK76776.1 DUF4917 domain-containing protein [Vibrio parahaemolyticus]